MRALVRSTKIRRIIRGITNDSGRADSWRTVRDQARLDRNQWLDDLIPLGTTISRDGVVFEDLLSKQRALSENGNRARGRIYLVDKHGQALCGTFGLGDLYLWDQIERAVRRLPVHEDYVRYVVWVTGFPWSRVVRIYKLPQGENLLAKAGAMRLYFLRALEEDREQKARKRNEEYVAAAQEAEA